MTVFVTWQLIVTMDSIRNSCDVSSSTPVTELGNTQLCRCKGRSQNQMIVGRWRRRRKGMHWISPPAICLPAHTTTTSIHPRHHSNAIMRFINNTEKHYCKTPETQSETWPDPWSDIGSDLTNRIPCQWRARMFKFRGKADVYQARINLLYPNIKSKFAMSCSSSQS